MSATKETRPKPGGYLFAGCVMSIAALLTLPALAPADGGTIRLSEQRGKYQITVFTAPAIVRAGPVDISVLVQDGATGEVTGPQVTIRAECRGAHLVTLQRQATTEAATNKLYRAATFDLPEPGSWDFYIDLSGDLGKAHVFFVLDVAPPLPPWQTWWPWIGWPAFVILLFGIHLLLVQSRNRVAMRGVALDTP
jgi:hypothetical protein